MGKMDEFYAYQHSAARVAIVQLVKLLTDNGTLCPGEFSDSLRATMSRASKSDRKRPDYQFLQQLIKMLEEI